MKTDFLENNGRIQKSAAARARIEPTRMQYRIVLECRDPRFSQAEMAARIVAASEIATAGIPPQTVGRDGSCPTKIIKLDAAAWTTPLDFYAAILPALGAPDWHGQNVNALTESMVWGEINSVEPPYTVEVYGTKNLPSDILQEMSWACEGLAAAREDFIRRRGRDVAVDLEIMS